MDEHELKTSDWWFHLVAAFTSVILLTSILLRGDLLLLRRVLRKPAHVPLYPSDLRLSNDEIQAGELLGGSVASGRRIVRVRDMIVKIGPEVDLDEAAAMAFIQQNTNVPTARLLSAYAEDGSQLIITEFVEGTLLSKVWPELPDDIRQTLLSELHHYLCEWRSLRRRKGATIGAVGGGRASDSRQFSVARGGPFKSEADFNDWQLAQFFDHVPIERRELFAGMHRTDHAIVFTHGDFAFHNVIVNNGHIAAIIDWEFSGWYPEHWEYCKSSNFLSGSDENYLAAKKIFPKLYHTESFMDQWFTRDVKHGGF